MPSNASRRLFGLFLAVAVVAMLRGFDVEVEEHGGTYRVAWRPGDIVMQIKMPTSPTFSDGSTPSTVLSGAMQTWNAQVGQVQFVPWILPPGPQIYRNSQNEVIMADSISGSAFGPYTLAVAISLDDGDDRVESDLVFNSAWRWDSYRGPLLPDREDMRRVALHELGHTLGLLHPDQAQPPQNVAALMNSIVSDLDELQADDIAGAQWLYGPAGFLPANDGFAQAEIVEHSAQTPITVSGTNIGATTEVGEPEHGGLPGGQSVWWKWTAPEDGSIELSTLGSNFDTVLAVYRGSSLANLEQIAFDDDEVDLAIRTSQVEFLIQSGVTYFIAVDGFDGFAGRILLTFGAIKPAGLPSIDVQPEDGGIYYLADATFTAEVSGAGPLTLQWWVQTTSGWTPLSEDAEHQGTTTATLTLRGDAALDGDSRYRLQVSNAIGTVTSNEVKVRLVYSAPIITGLPDYIDVVVGDTLELSPKVVGDPNPTFAWHNLAQYEPIATSQTLRIEAVTLADAGLYYVVVKGRQGSKTSNSVNVRVLPEAAKGTVMVSAGAGHFLHLRSSGWAFGAGINSNEVLGTSQGVNGAILRPAPLLNDVVRVDATRTSSQLLLGDGTLLATDGPGNDVLTVRATNVAVSDSTQPFTDYITREGKLYRWNQYGADSEGGQELKDVAIGDQRYVIDADGSLWRPGDWLNPTLFVSSNVLSVSGMSNAVVFARADGSAAYAKVSGSGSSSQLMVTPIEIDHVIAVAGGAYHALFLTADGVLWADGDNQFGQLGDGTLENRSKPVPVADKVWTMAAGESVSVFAKKDGSVWAMGRGSSAPFGNDLKEDSSIPVLVSEGPVTLPTAPGNLDASNDASYDLVRLSWSGSLGATYYEVWRSVTDDLSSAQLLADRVTGMITYDVSAATGVVYYYWVRGVNQAGAGAFSVSNAGETKNDLPVFTLQPVDAATQSDGRIWLNAQVESYPSSTLRWEMKAPDAVTWTALTNGGVVSGVTSSRLSLSAPGMAWNGAQFRCVATNFAGSRTSAIATINLEQARAVVHAASGNNMVVYVTDDGTLWARGDNSGGQLGNGSRTANALPVKMMDDVVAVDVIGGETVILRADGTLWMRSSDASDLALGGETATSDRPFKVADNVVRAEAGATFVLYQDRQGRLWIAGNDVFAPGAGEVTLSVPRMVAEHVIDFDASWYHAAFVTASGNLWVGGWQDRGRLGSGIQNSNYSFGPMWLAEDVAQCAVSELNTFFIKRDGSLWGAGDPFYFYSESGGGGVGLRPTFLAESITRMSVSARHLLYQTTTGELGGFGTGSQGSLGPNVPAFTLPRLLGIDAGVFAAGSEASLIIDRDGRLWGFGRNDNFMLTDDSTLIHATPELVASGPEAPLGSAVSPSASVNTAVDHVRLSWTPGRGDWSYSVWHSLESDFETATRLVSGWIAPVYYDHDAVGGVENHYWIVAESVTGMAQVPVPVVGQREARFPLDVSPRQISVSAVENSVDLQITSDTAWTLQTDAPWLNLSTDSGINTGSVTVSVAFNGTESERVGLVMVNAQTVVITQQANVAQVPEFLTQPASQIRSAGGSVLFSVSALGLPRPSFQWFIDGELITGATSKTLQLTDLSASDEGEYTAVASNEWGATTSAAARLTLYDVDDVVQASHTATSSAPLPGESLTISNQILFPAGLERLRWTALLPDGWVLAGSSGVELASLISETGVSSLAEWEWSEPAGQSLSFTFDLIAPDYSPAEAAMISYVETVNAGDHGAVLATPDPLLLTVRPDFHAADSNRDWTFDLSELLRVIELYNTRTGTTRTGRYRTDAATTDGFAPDALSEGELIRIHSADTDADGQFSLSELLRVIELYNTRSGTVRSGAYRRAESTSDGFESAP